jgi:tRNA-uridine 2-sulfurtransferase
LKHKALALLSGGLDSTLAIKLMLDLGFDVTAVNFTSPFCLCNRSTDGTCSHVASQVAKELGVEIKIVYVGEEYLDVVKNPKFGYGKNMNPCLDCRIFIFKKAKKFMEEIGASFIITGEVLGQRPMSQRRDAMNLIDRESGLKGYIVRPLSAKLLEPTIPETEGIIDREKLLKISGRSRKPQMKLVEDFHIQNFACPAGGCLLTDMIFAGRMRDLLKYSDSPSLVDINLLKTGRHFRISSQCKVVVGRNHSENERIEELAGPEDYLFHAEHYKGPLALCRGTFDEETASLVAGITAKYSKAPEGERVEVSFRRNNDDESGKIEVKGISDEQLTKLRI